MLEFNAKTYPKDNKIVKQDDMVVTAGRGRINPKNHRKFFMVFLREIFISRLGFMLRMSAESGEAINEMEHLKQCIRDVLLTPVGTRIMRRSYGSRLMHLLDQPINEAFIAAAQGAVVEAINNYEPRIKLTRVIVNGVDAGVLNLTIEGFYVPDSRVIRLENISIK